MAGDLQSSGGGRKSSTGTAAATALRPLEQGLKCPRCNSPNTKFCYYNNYSLSQPRHFCKSCRRYWTKGGTLRNVPMGGGSRKNKKQPKASASSRLLPVDPISGFPEPSTCSALNFLGGLPSSPAAADFHIGLATTPRLIHAPTTASAGVFDGYHEFINLVDGPHASLAGFNYPISAYSEADGGSIVSSIESLSSINQDLHWRLQQQRLAELCGAEEHKGNREDRMSCDHAERDKVCGSGINGCGGRTSSSAAAWTSTFLENSCSFSTSTSMTNSSKRSSNISLSNWSGSIPAAWNDMPQFSAIP